MLLSRHMSLCIVPVTMALTASPCYFSGRRSDTA